MIYDYLRDIKYRNSENPSSISTSKVAPSKTQTPEQLQTPDEESEVTSEVEAASINSGSDGNKSRKGEASDKAAEPVDYSPGPRLRPQNTLFLMNKTR